MSTREMSVAGQFYPDNPNEIEAMFKEYNAIVDEHITDKSILDLKPRAVIVPHAGYVYSAFTANMALRLLGNTQVKRVVVIGPSHKIALRGTSIAEYNNYETPMGSLPIDKELVSELKERFGLTCTPDAHHEHSTEVQLPFIKIYKPDVSVAELVYGEENPENLSKLIDYLLEDPKIALVISTDLSHYYDIEKANRLDSVCLNAVKNLDEDELRQGCEACGKTGVEAMLLSAKKRGLKSVLLDYRTSADASGDKAKVVGYMSAAFVEE